MRLFAWTSNVVEGHYPGLVVVSAPDVDTARTKAREHFHTVAFPRDDRSSPAWHTKTFLFENDIKAEPVCHGDGVLFVDGSD